MRRKQTITQYLVMAALAATTIALGQAHRAGSEENSSSAASIAHGDPTNGRVIFDGPGDCLTCHRVGAVGAILGPNLSDVGLRLSPEGIAQAVLTPPPQVEPRYRLYEIVTTQGKMVRGKLLNQDPFSLQMLESGGELVAFSRSQVREGRFVKPPEMPSYRHKLTGVQIRDLIAYLASLRAPDKR